MKKGKGKVADRLRDLLKRLSGRVSIVRVPTDGDANRSRKGLEVKIRW